MALYIVPERNIDGFDPFVNGQALARCDDLDRLAAEAGVRPLIEFLDQSPDDVADLLGEEIEPPEGGWPEVAWHDAAEGLATVRGLIRRLSDGPGEIRNADDLIEDLKEFEAVLGRLADEGVRWHLGIDL